MGIKKTRLFIDGLRTLISTPPNNNITVLGRLNWFFWKLKCFLYYQIPKKLWLKIYKNERNS